MKSVEARWKQIGIQLGIPNDTLKTITADNPLSCGDCFAEMINEWLRLNYDDERFGRPSWRKLAEAVVTINKRLFYTIAYEHEIETEEDEGESNQACSVSEKQEATPGIEPLFEMEEDIASIHSFTPSECGLSKEKYEKMKPKIRADSMAIVSKYEQLLTGFQHSLERRDISVKKLASYLLGFEAFDPVYARDKSNEIVFAEEYETLRKATDIHEALSLVKMYSSFFSYQILEQLILCLGTDDDKEQLKKYEKAFQEYAKRRLFKCPSKIGSDTGQAKIVITLDRAFKDSTLSHLILLTENLHKIFGISITGVLRLYSISGGSIKLIYFLPHFVQKSIFPLTKEQEQELEKLQVVKCYSHKKTSNTHQMVSEHYNVIVL